MAQGAGKLKSGKTISAGSSRKKAGQTRPGKFVVAPKTKAHIAAKTQEKVSSGFTFLGLVSSRRGGSAYDRQAVMVTAACLAPSCLK